jgi:8-oxo-dGTP pyrophosphatase MutT (NUDIX family)
VAACVRGDRRERAAARMTAIRPIAICVFRHRDRILVFEGHDRIKPQTFYRPLGGAIEFGELGRDTIVREIREEIAAEVREVRYLGTLENRFTFEGRDGHEIVLVYAGELVDRALYERDAWEGHEDSGAAMPVLWMPIGAFGPERPLYPDGLLELLARVA